MLEFYYHKPMKLKTVFRVQSFEETVSDKQEKSFWNNPVFQNEVSRVPVFAACVKNLDFWLSLLGH